MTAPDRSSSMCPSTTMNSRTHRRNRRIEFSLRPGRHGRAESFGDRLLNSIRTQQPNSGRFTSRRLCIPKNIEPTSEAPRVPHQGIALQSIALIELYKFGLALEGGPLQTRNLVITWPKNLPKSSHCQHAFSFGALIGACALSLFRVRCCDSFAGA